MLVTFHSSTVVDNPAIDGTSDKLCCLVGGSCSHPVRRLGAAELIVADVFVVGGACCGTGQGWPAAIQAALDSPGSPPDPAVTAALPLPSVGRVRGGSDGSPRPPSTRGVWPVA